MGSERSLRRCDNESVGERTQHVTYSTPYVVG